MAVDEEELSPCIVVRGFPDAWREEQVKLVFAVFGGVSVLRLGRDADGRVARVKLKHVDKMAKAVEQLDGTQVGDGELIEECVISCHLRGASGSGDASPPGSPSAAAAAAGSPGGAGADAVVSRCLFVDELEMPKRPEAAPGPNDRELFVERLPVGECDEEQVRSWLEGFGEVERLVLLSAKGVVAGANGAKSGARGALSGKGYVVFKSHDSALACAEANDVSVVEPGDIIASWSESERATQGSSSVYCSDVHSAFSLRVLASAQQAAGVPVVRMAGSSRRGGGSAALSAGSVAAQLHFVADCDEAKLELIRRQLSSALAEYHAATTARLRSGATPAGSPRGASPSSAATASAPPRPSFPHSPSAPFPPSPPAGAASSSTAPAPGAGAGASAPPGIAETAIRQGEALVQEAQAISGDGAQTTKAYQLYCQGIQILVDAVSKYPEDDPEAQRLRLRVDRYLSEAERLKKPQSAGERPAQSASAGAPASSAPEQSAAGRGRQSSSPSTFAGASGHGGAGAGSSFDPGAGLPPSGKEKMSRGEAFIAEGRDAELRGLLQEAYAKYCSGLQVLIEVMPLFGEKSANAAAMQAKVSEYLRRAELVKAKLPQAASPASSSSGARGPGGGAPGGGGGGAGGGGDGAGGSGRFVAFGQARGSSARDASRRSSPGRGGGCGGGGGGSGRPSGHSSGAVGASARDRERDRDRERERARDRDRDRGRDHRDRDHRERDHRRSSPAAAAPSPPSGAGRDRSRSRRRHGSGGGGDRGGGQKRSRSRDGGGGSRKTSRPGAPGGSPLVFTASKSSAPPPGSRGPDASPGGASAARAASPAAAPAIAASSKASSPPSLLRGPEPGGPPLGAGPPPLAPPPPGGPDARAPSGPASLLVGKSKSKAKSAPTMR